MGVLFKKTKFWYIPWVIDKLSNYGPSFGLLFKLPYVPTIFETFGKKVLDPN